MSFKLYNTRTREKEEFKTIDNSNTVRIYSCGPTVYDYAHIGNFSMYIFTDLLRRYLENGPQKFSVKHVMNITDVGHLKVDNDENYDLNATEDKLELASKKNNINPWEISKKYTDAFVEDMKKLNIISPTFMPRATENIRQMQDIIEKLVDNGYAYISDQENVYFDVSKFPSYGNFSGKTLKDLEAGKGGRIDVEELLKDKKNIFDFSLWITDESHIMKWDFPSVIKSGKMGYPGWHIECSAMSMRYLTDVFNSEIPDFSKFKTLDIHTGGEDHIFPHHEDEIAQSEGVTGMMFSNFWLHRKHILVNGEKMSKSKGNFYTISDLENGKLGGIKFSALDFRMWVLLGHYRTQRDFTLETMKEAKNTREKITEFYKEILIDSQEDQTIKVKLNNIEVFKTDVCEYISNFWNLLDNDLNTPGAFSVIFQIIHDYIYIDKEKSKKLIEFLNEFNSIFAIIDTNKKNEEIPEEIKTIADERWEAKLNKNFSKSDELRNKLLELGYEMKDEKDNYKIIKK
ncbi:MAG: cysteine--tRNA ligase [Patescibacteria group bacterium]